MVRSAHSEKEEVILLASLFVFESSLVIMAMAMNLRGERPFAVFLSRGSGTAFLCAIVAFFIACWVIVHRYLFNKQLPSCRVNLVVMTNLVTVLLLVLMGEVIVRASSQSYLDGEAFMGVVLKPRNWEQAKQRTRQILESEDREYSLMLHDDRLGWTVGPNRSGFRVGVPYRINAEGVRVSYDEGSLPTVDGKTKISIIGDSFTFGDEVRYEETWGYHLDQLLGKKIQVLNYGVPGYGLGQMLLRYEKDIARSNPNVVILGFIDNDLFRTMTVYPLLHAPSWAGLVSKPRFALQGGKLTIINECHHDMEQFFSRGSISELPFVEYDRAYQASDWEQRWHHVSYLARLFMSLGSSASVLTADISDKVLVSLNAAILKRFAESVISRGAVPLIIYFPSLNNFNQGSSYSFLAKRVLQEAGFPHLDPTPCLLEVPLSVRFAPGNHYSPQGNAAVAECLVDAVREAIDKPFGGRT
ncbi:MAG: hypothetical protein KF751_05885 [Nitrospira sp.]|uniref:SGNH/GDSL hydrolase family protein n=1 Tax=Nitrospira sp. BLG_1 TaxID=3395883 RepID=UPI001D550CEB|nr:hypothetical protein [Nitrospira sp.]